MQMKIPLGIIKILTTRCKTGELIHEFILHRFEGSTWSWYGLSFSMKTLALVYSLFCTVKIISLSTNYPLYCLYYQYWKRTFKTGLYDPLKGITGPYQAQVGSGTDLWHSQFRWNPTNLWLSQVKCTWSMTGTEWVSQIHGNLWCCHKSVTLKAESP